MQVYIVEEKLIYGVLVNIFCIGQPVKLLLNYLVCILVYIITCNKYRFTCLLIILDLKYLGNMFRGVYEYRVKYVHISKLIFFLRGFNMRVLQQFQSKFLFM